jgi:HAD superfamily hydrolase (TIGR01509 family)
MPDPIQAVLFDFAGTLFMPQRASRFVLAAAHELGLDLSPADCERLADACLAAGFPGAPYPQSVPERLRGVYEQRDLSSDSHRAAYSGLLSTVEMPDPNLAGAIYEQIREPAGWVPYADARDLLDELAARGVRAGVVSNVGFNLRPILRAHGFAELAFRCTMSYEVGATKPDPRIFQAALRSLDASASTTLMVGDHHTADRGAEALGIRTLILPMTPPETVHGLRRVLELVGAP